MSKTTIRQIFRWTPVRVLVLGLCKASALAARLASLAQAARYFPQNDSVICHWSVTVKYPERITLGQNVILGPNSIIGAHGGIEMGDDVHLSEGVVIETAGLDFSQLAPYPHISKPIRIGKGTWIGTKAIILGGVTIGEGAVIGANAVVTKDVPANAIFVGARGGVLPAQRGANVAIAAEKS